MNGVDIRLACYGDITPLSQALGGELFFADRFERQKNDRGVLFVALVDDEPVGDVYLWWEPADEFLIRKYLPGVALLTHLEVLPAYRNRGIGSKLIAAVENYLFDRGDRQVALAVRDDNDTAKQLYLRLGYQDWGYGKLVCFADLTGVDGKPRIEPELCYVLVKRLHSIKPSSESTLDSFPPLAVGD